MKRVLLFRKDQWNTKDVDSFLSNIKMEAELRYGFTHILAICNNEGKVRVADLKNEKKIICVRFDKEKGIVGKEAFFIEKNNVEQKDLEFLLKAEENLAFDLYNFGYLPVSDVSIEELFKVIRNSKPAGEVDILQFPKGIEKIMENSSVPDNIKKIILDVYTLEATSSLINVVFSGKEDVLNRYSNVFLFSLVVRAKMEKLILLLATIDDALDFGALDGSKKVKKVFINQSQKSQFKLTKMMASLMQDVDLLDDNYRTPEIHKMGRLLGLIYKNNFGTLVNEICSFYNKSNGIFQGVCSYLENKYCKDSG